MEPPALLAWRVTEGPVPSPPSEEPSVDLPGKVCQLEAMLKQLHNDLQKVPGGRSGVPGHLGSLSARRGGAGPVPSQTPRFCA